jgi:hypothetical protein
MTQLTTKAFAVLANLDVYKEAEEKARAKRVASIKTEVYSQVEARVALPKVGRVNTGVLHMQRWGKAEKAEPSIAAKLFSMELEEKAYLDWVEAHSTRREIEESWAKQFSADTMQMAEAALIDANALLAEAVKGLRIHRAANPTTWVQDLYKK